MRVENWDVLLADAVEAARDRPFEWGQHDCMTWAADVRAALIDGDAPDWKGAYTTELGAAKYLKKLGFADYEAAARSVMGEPLSTPRLAQRGDVILTDGFGICIGRVFVAPSDTGLMAYQMRLARMAWRV